MHPLLCRVHVKARGLPIAQGEMREKEKKKRENPKGDAHEKTEKGLDMESAAERDKLRGGHEASDEDWARGQELLPPHPTPPLPTADHSCCRPGLTWDEKQS